ncbi:MAG: DNA polymerase [Ruminococcus sp.]|nr:DNA polymerase [Ruminococcus sp.]
MKNLSIDIETYSDIDLKKAGLYKYVQSPQFQIILFAYRCDDEPVQVVDLAQGERIPFEIQLAMMNPKIIKRAYNAAFEWYCLSKYLQLKPETQTAWLGQWRCTMLHGLYLGYPSGLAAIGEALKLPQDKKKMGVGQALIRYFCKPCKPTKANGNRTRNLPKHEPEKWELFKEYCKQDVYSENSIWRMLSVFPVSDDVQKQWELDMRINANGVNLDRELIDGALHCNALITDELMNEATQLTGLRNPKSVAQLKKWLTEELSEDVNTLSKTKVAELLDRDLPSSDVGRVLEIRQELGKSSVSKYEAMETCICSDGRARGLLQFYGGNRTGRWAGRLIQVQNLPRNYIESLDTARELVRKKNVEAIRLLYGNVPDTLSQLIRTAFIPSKGNKFVVADFSAIEARVIAWLAGEQWRLDVFNTHGKIYEASASSMFGVPIELIKKGNPEYALRAKGKVAELALGYQGSAGALINMGALDMGLSEEELPDIVQRWRKANPRIKDLWYACENTALEVMTSGRRTGINKNIIFAREYDINSGLDFFTVQLPSGRKLYYPHPFLAENDFGKQALHYYGVNQKTGKWGVIATYGGKLTENIVQAVARDCLAVTLERLDAAGLQVVMHIHDEAVIDCPKDKISAEKACELMGQPISWAEGLPLKAAGFESEYYMKD